MLLVAERGVEDQVFAVFKKWGLDAVEIGTVTDDGMLRVRNHGELVAEVPNSLLTDDAPLYDRPATTPFRSVPLDGPTAPTTSADDNAAALKQLVASPDLCSKRKIYEQYDYMVRTNTTVPPGSDAAVIRIKEANVSLAMALDGNGRYTALDPREGAKLAVAECCRNLATVGAEPVAATNCLNFGNPEKPEIMAQFIEAVEGLGEACRHFGTPITGGNVSLYNETLGAAIYPTPVIGIVGLIDHMDVPVPMHFQQPGRKIILVGGLLPGVTGDKNLERRFGSTQYAKVVVGQTWGLPPALDMDYEKRVHETVRSIVRQGLPESVHDLSDGGLAVGLAKCGFGSKRIGARIELSSEFPSHVALFHEAPSRVLLSVADENIEAVNAIAAALAIPAPVIGETQVGSLEVQLNGDTFHASIDDLYQAWDSALERMLQG